MEAVLSYRYESRLSNAAKAVTHNQIIQSVEPSQTKGR